MRGQWLTSINERKEVQMKKIIFVLLLALLVLASGAVQASAANSPAEFYNGKVITIHTRETAGSNDDMWARTLAAHLPDIIKGAKFAVTNEPAGGGRVIQNTFASTIPKDGLHTMFLAAGTMWPAFMTGDPTIITAANKYSHNDDFVI
jgi:tripartite-type tricarboxylate transporter receptor subunit TctC